MKSILSWNVNGIRSIVRKNALKPVIDQLDPDVICLQEIKVHEEVSVHLDKYPYKYWNFGERRGYAGVAVFSKIQPSSIKLGIGHRSDSEGRVIALTFDDFILVNVYVMNSGSELERLTNRKSFDDALRKYIEDLSLPVVVMGDFNVAPLSKNQTDRGHDYFGNSRSHSAGLTNQERTSFTKLLKTGLVDTFRALYPDVSKWTYWNFRAKSRKNGWRIDFALVSEDLYDRVRDSTIHDDLYGSDHCPIVLHLK